MSADAAGPPGAAGGRRRPGGRGAGGTCPDRPSGRTEPRINTNKKKCADDQLVYIYDVGGGRSGRAGLSGAWRSRARSRSGPRRSARIGGRAELSQRECGVLRRAAGNRGQQDNFCLSAAPPTGSWPAAVGKALPRSNCPRQPAPQGAPESVSRGPEDSFKTHRPMYIHVPSFINFFKSIIS